MSYCYIKHGILHFSICISLISGAKIKQCHKIWNTSDGFSEVHGCKDYERCFSLFHKGEKIRINITDMIF
jgi:hypothetical protein